MRKYTMSCATSTNLLQTTKIATTILPSPLGDAQANPTLSHHTHHLAPVSLLENLCITPLLIDMFALFYCIFETPTQSMSVEFIMCILFSSSSSDVSAFLCFFQLLICLLYLMLKLHYVLYMYE